MTPPDHAALQRLAEQTLVIHTQVMGCDSKCKDCLLSRGVLDLLAYVARLNKTVEWLRAGLETEQRINAEHARIASNG